MRNRALVTGATCGIGYAFATWLARCDNDLVLVARDADRLEARAAELRERHGVRVEVLPADLSDPARLARVVRRVEDPEHPVDLLVNNAGSGLGSRTVDASPQEQRRQLDVMVGAVLALSRAAVGSMTVRGHGGVINVASAAAFLPTGAYAAAKAWVLSYTVSLAGELHATGVFATVLCPGLVRTEFHRRAGLDCGDVPSWAWLAPDDVVDGCMKDVRRGRTVSIPSRRYRTAVGVARHLPLRLQNRIVRRAVAS